MVVWPQLVKDHMVDWDILSLTMQDYSETLNPYKVYIKCVCMRYLLVGGQT